MLIPTYTTLERPLMLEEVQKLTGHGQEFLSCLVRIDLPDLIRFNIEGLNDYVEERILGTAGYLEDISYNVVWCEPELSNKSYGAGSIILRVNGDASNWIYELEETRP